MGCCGKKTGDKDRSDDIEMKEKGKYGKSKEFDPSFNGPIKNRSCTDIPCCILFVLYIIGMLALGGAAFYMGNPYKLLNSVDSFGNICGYSPGFVDKPKLVFFDMTVCISPAGFANNLFAYSCPTTQICRKKCPDFNAFATSLNGDDLVCRYDVNTVGLSYMDKLRLVKDKQCAPYILKSTDVMNRCVPTILTSQLGNLFPTENNATGTNVTGKAVQDGSLYIQALLKFQNLGLKVIADVQASWYWILGGLGIAMVASFIYILVMRWIAGLIVWLTTYAVLTLIGFSVYYSWTQYTLLKSNANATSSVDIVLFGLDQYTNSVDTWYYLTIILGIILGILVLLLLALRKRIQIAIALIKESSKAITNMVFSLFFPLIPWLLQLILFGWFVSVLAFLVTAGSANYSTVDNNGTIKSPCDFTQAVSNKYGVLNNDTTCKFINFNDNNHIFRMQIYHLFGWFWIMNFIIALGQCVLAGAFASYYWAYDKKNDVPTFPVAASFYRTLRYHTGSLAFGSLIIAIVQLIRASLEYIDHQLNGSPGQQGEIAKYIMKCLKCCFWCLEKFLKFLNKNAYIEVAVYGKNFCVSAKNAFFLLMRNILRVVVLDKVTDFILFLGQLSITFGVGVGSFYWFKRQANLNYYLAPVFIIVIGSYVISSAFFSVYNMAIDTVFLCFLEDLERNDGSEQKPYYMSNRLKKILGKKKKKDSDED